MPFVGKLIEFYMRGSQYNIAMVQADYRSQIYGREESEGEEVAVVVFLREIAYVS